MIDVARPLREPSLRRPSSLSRLLAVALAIGLASGGSVRGEDSAIGWDPGHGARLPGGLWLAGDVTADGEVLEGEPASVELDDLSLLARWEPTSRFAFFGEMRLEDLVTLTEGAGVETGTGDVAVERLYAEILLSPTLTLRVGKIYTPFGLWNEVRRAPLTWTVERPAITENVFPQHATGLDLLYQTTWRGWSFDANTYGPAQDELRFRRTDEDDLDENGLMFGGRVAAGHALGPAFAALGLNAAGFRPHDGTDWWTVTGLDLDVAVGGHQLTGELTFRIPPNGRRTLQGLYLQDVIPLEPLLPCAREFYGVLRFEQMQPTRGPSAVGGVVGLFWRPIPPLVLRANYLFANRTVREFEPGFQFGVSLLF